MLPILLRAQSIPLDTLVQLRVSRLSKIPRAPMNLYETRVDRSAARIERTRAAGLVRIRGRRQPFAQSKCYHSVEHNLILRPMEKQL